MNNPNLNFSMMSNESLVAYRDSVAEQAEQLRSFKHDTLLELGHRGVVLFDLNQGFTGALNLHHMTTPQVVEYAEGLMPRVDEMQAKLDAANQELGQRRYSHNSAA